MKTCTTFSGLAILLVSLILVTGCKKKNTEPAATAPIPDVSTGNYTNVLLNTIDFTGTVTADHGYIVTKRGFCWSSANQNPTIQNDTMISPVNLSNSFSGEVKHLKGQTTYYIRAYATNINGTGYGSAVGVITIDTTITDVENNHYRIVQIGTQVWMAENLKTTKFNDGTSIPLVTDNSAWNNLSTPGYCWYDNDAATYKNTYGALYNWYTVNTGTLAPAGWHVPTDAEWTILTDFLGGETVAGGKLKEAGTTHWQSPNTGATNETGFTALPGGYRGYFGAFYNVGNYGVWWSSTEDGTSYVWDRSMDYIDGGVSRTKSSKEIGFSVRCLRD
jgi:uncharacterized protein (TIGR02145 family)